MKLDWLKTPQEIYIAGRYKEKKTLLEKAEILIAHGHVITSSWLAVPPTAEASYAYAIQDLRDIQDSSLFLYFAGDPTQTSGGKEFELGFATALQKNIICIGQPTHIFGHLFIPHYNLFSNWEIFKKAFVVGK